MQAEPIVFGTTPNLQTAPVVVAAEKGYFDEEGVEVEFVNFTSGRAALEAIIGGQLDMGFMAEYPVAVAALNEQEFRVVAGLSKYAANRIISKASVGFETVHDLEGKRVGTTVGSNAAYFAELVLGNAGVNAEIVNVAPPDIVPALARGDIDAGVMFPDFYPAAAEALGDDYREQLSSDYIANFVLAASPAMVDERAADVEAFLRALVKAESFIEENPSEAQAILSQATQGALTPEAVAGKWSEAEYAIVLDETLVELLLSQAQWVVEGGILSGDLSREKLLSYFATDALESVDPDRVSLD
ncbi:ABC transporter substrate-binding protein [Chelativorans sp. AA-79]|uniref:ABC transporter substrate-binding protein n=1 Tax=Chelativorans sp. AA-79 TaxID=3028735 RepID=UPI0023F63DD6|nr:ABC transporter substrate-binding protein [Chelativorans sp. AA-79]WEX10701.1 ABC transporter substrate-binding protein [Chelativorans sp. AA-79]